ncbi:MAG: hypothetical protein PHW31_00610 [Candidatus Pacebacteria bacterium]|nr:hypothetical protein [Candidatus Paceibacterota bacterium]
MTLNAKQKIKIYFATFFLAALLLVFLGLAPLLSGLLKTSRELAAQKDTLALIEGQIAALEEFQKNNSAYQTNVQKIGAGFVSEEAPIEFIEFLESEARKQSLDIIVSSVKEASEKNSLRVTTIFQIAVGGPFPKCLTFLKRLEESPWLIKIDQANINRVEENNKPLSFKNLKEGDVVLNLSFKTFSRYLTSVVK